MKDMVKAMSADERRELLLNMPFEEVLEYVIEETMKMKNKLSRFELIMMEDDLK